MNVLGESDFEETTIERLGKLGYEYLHGQELFQRGERDRLQEVVLHGRLATFLRHSYPMIPTDEVDRLANVFALNEGVGWEDRNFYFHQKCVKGLEFVYEEDNEEKVQHVYPIDWEHPENNDFLVVNQFSIEGRMSRRPDVVIFVNGLPLIVFELKNPNKENVTVHDAYNQIRNYTHDISKLFEYNAFTVVSDGVETMHGMPSAAYDFFASWKTIDGVSVDNNVANTMRTLIQGLFPKDRLLNYIRNFIVFLDKGDKRIKIGAKYHQYFGVNFAVDETVRATSPDGDRRIGVMYHTTGSGKSISMLFYSSILAKHKQLDNPTIVIQVDRNDLDVQLHDTFSEGYSLIGHIHHAEKSDQLRDLLKGEGGQIVFSTIEKFRLKEGEAKHPVLSDRSNIIVISDEAHRTQSGFDGGYAAQLRYAVPNASFVGFTGTPVQLLGNNTEEIFGHVIHRYDMAQAVQDKAVLPLYYESRMIPLDFAGAGIDEEYESIVTEIGMEDEESDSYKLKWAALEKVVGTPKRLHKLAGSILDHFNAAANPYQKGMIVCMSRQVAVRLYEALKQRDDCPEVEIVMTGKIAKDPDSWRKQNPGSKYAHIKTKEEQEDVKKRLKNPEDPLKLVIVVSMWLTGFDAPNLSFLYVDKPMHGHNLIQAIARVNRVFPGKEGGLIVDFIGIATSLKEATNNYTGDNATNQTNIDVDAAVGIFQKHLKEVRGLFGAIEHRDDWRALPKIERDDLIADLVNEQLNGDPESFVETCVKLEKAYKLIKHLQEIIPLADEVTLYQMVRVQVKKLISPRKVGTESNETIEERLNQLVDSHLETKDPVDIYQVAGIEKPDISILDEAFLKDIESKQEHEDLRLKLLQKLLEGHITVNFKKNSPKERQMRELLEKTLTDYHNRIIQAADVVRMMVEMRKDVDEEAEFRGELGLNDEEAEFYKAITGLEMESFDNAFLADLIHKVVKELKKNLSQDWTSDHRKNIYAKVKISVKNVLMRENIKGQQLLFITNAIMKEAVEQYGDWPNEA
ncbi:type I restriction endonuclease subunit R [Lentibacillus sp. Marseille-P4043]|uniref:type I restriction endonuclease subunit R n=1 Tax=Lentibacillus sp. Marseille-P4043 TaxID=2040293 RepID=UPI000D0B627D|nr:type I restriction endonuclease subunit R [Lentibacillus sp. Marseille-P4043]